MFESNGGRRRALWVGRILFGSGALALGWSAFVVLHAMAYRHGGLDAAKAWPSGEARVSAGESMPAADPPLAPGTPIGVLEIPRLKYSEVVAEGDNPATLKTAIGHLPDTPLPGTTGNAVLAGHRDTHFRALKKIAIGDEMRLRTKQGVFTYRVEDKVIVQPTDMSVLGGSGRRLTLVTCYPFSYIGSAPQRFVVTAVAAR